MPSLLITLIHNNDANRLKTARNVISEVKKASVSIFETSSIEISYQPNDKQFSKKSAVWREYLFWKIRKQWQQYCMIKRQPAMLGWLYFLLHIVRQYLPGNGPVRQNLVRHTRDMYITHKHVLAWNTFLESNKDFLIVFEDDIMLHEGQTARLKSLLHDIGKKQFGGNGIYVSLADGFPKEELQAGKLLLKSELGFDYYKKPITNTSCGYAMNKTLVRAISSYYFLNPRLKYLPIDWFANALFVRLEKNNMPCYCIHASPGIFEHGSRSGAYSDWRSPEI